MKIEKDQDFISKIVKAFLSIYKEIEKGAVESDIRPRFVKYFIEQVLCYNGSDYRYEKSRTDLTIFDENKFPIIKIETKKPGENIDKKEYEEQAFKYIEETTRYIILTNFTRLKLWEVTKTQRILKVDLDFNKIFKKTGELPSNEKSQILFLNTLTKDVLFNQKKYEKFDETYARIDITKDAGFKKLLERLNYIVNVLLWPYIKKSFGEYKEGYARYLEELKKVEEAKKNNDDKEINRHLIKYEWKLQFKEYEKYIPFKGFKSWKYYSGKEDVPDSEVIDIFCKETIYALLNKLLFIRICEDKGLLKRNISNGGIEKLRELVSEEEAYKKILELAFSGARSLYVHFYEIGILDWYKTSNHELDKILNQVLWILNQFDFAHVHRDILGNLYEQYLPGEERKKLGEFYTPVAVIDYILTSVGYTYNYEIGDKDLLDPCCGSGGFLVRATRRLISYYLRKFNKAFKNELREPKNWKEIVNRLSAEEAKIILEAIQEHIYGLDINPFACNIAEMNILFQVIDLYQKVREKYKNYKLKRFKIYQTDSLELPRQKEITDYGNHLRFEEQEAVGAIKNKKFDFVVENPPYVRGGRISKTEKRELAKNYSEIYHGDNDYCVYFLYRSTKWLNERGKFGLIVSSKFTKTRYGKYIRAFVAENMHISRFIDLRGSKIFANVTVDPCILILDKEKFKNIRVISVKKDFEGKGWEENLGNLIWHIFRRGVQDYRDEYVRSFTVDQSVLQKNIKWGDGKKASDEWKLISEKESSIIKKIEEKANYRLKDIVVDIQTGVQTGIDKVFVVPEKVVKTEKLERSVLKRFIFGKDVRRWKISYNNYFLIYPYKLINGKTVLIPEKELMNNYPNICDYLKRHIEELKERWGVNVWYELPTRREIEWFEGAKILTPDISTSNNFTLDKGEFYFPKKPVYGILLKKDFNNYILYVLGLLNSKVLEFYFKQIATYLGKEGYRYQRSYLEKLPLLLPRISEQKNIATQIIKKVNDILEINKKLQPVDIKELLREEETNKLHQIASFSMQDDTKFEEIKEDRNKLFINSIDYIEIKDKRVFDFVRAYLNSIQDELKKLENIKEIIYNIEIPKSKSVAKEIIEKVNFGDMEKLREKTEKLEDEINELVYGLYNITEKEKKIIEETVK